jgi:hypothetical protein
LWQKQSIVAFKMSVSKDIPIKVFNETSNTSGVKVVIFAKNASAQALESYHWPWHILNLFAGMADVLVYPAESSLEARWSGISLHGPLLMGPLPVKSGSTWEILQPEESGTPSLQQG